MENYSLPKDSKIFKIANNKKKKKISELLQMKEQMVTNNMDEKTIKKFIDEQYELINVEYQKCITKKVNTTKIMNKKRTNAIQFLLKNKSFLEQNNANPEYIKEYVKKQYDDINKTYTQNDNINFID